MLDSAHLTLLDLLDFAALRPWQRAGVTAGGTLRAVLKAAALPLARVWVSSRVSPAWVVAAS